MKLAFAVGTMVAGKRLKLSPRAIADLVTTQLENNPQFKEIGDQLRQDLRGVGTAATGALVERQIEGLAGRLHSRTQGVQDRIAGVSPDVDDVRDAGERATGLVTGRGRDRDDEPSDDRYEDEARYEDDRAPARNSDETGDDREDRSRPGRGGGARSSATKRAPAKKDAAKRPAADKAAANGAKKATRTAPKTAGSATRASKGGRGRG
nr:DNA primase [Streptomyces sp. SID8379]